MNLADLQRGASFGALCEALCHRANRQDGGATALKAARYLQQWVNDGWIVRAAM